MGRRIYKYQLEVTDEQIVRMPTRAQILSFQFQNGVACIWAIVRTENEPANRRLRIFGTGNPMDEFGEFIATAQDGGLVWHLFDMGEVR